MSLSTRHNFGWLPDLPDFRDLIAFPSKNSVPARADLLPKRLDLREIYPFQIKDQGRIGSCVAHAVGSAIEYEQGIRPNDPLVSDFLEQDRKFPISRLFLYYEARKVIGLVEEDSGCHIRDAMRVAYNIGVPRETGWKYEEGRFMDEPPVRQYKSAPYHKISSYRSVAVDNNEIKIAVAGGSPVVFGISLFSSFYDADGNGVVPMPRHNDYYLGGHAMLIVGYDDASGRYTVLNSWGRGWGDQGFAYIPYAYVGNPRYGSDYWVLNDQLYKERFDE